MKKAEEYFKFMSSEDGIINLYEDSKTDFINAIKQAQIDAVEEAVNRCAENANVTDGNNVLEHFYSDYGVKIYANAKSILQVAN